MIKLFVDELDMSIAYTSSIDNFNYNIVQLGTNYAENFKKNVEQSDTNEFTDILALGKYLIIIQQLKGLSGMIFLDTENNLEKVLHFSNTLLSHPDMGDFREKYLTEFHKMKPIYEKQTSEVELIIHPIDLN